MQELQPTNGNRVNTLYIQWEVLRYKKSLVSSKETQQFCRITQKGIPQISKIQSACPTNSSRGYPSVRVLIQTYSPRRLTKLKKHPENRTFEEGISSLK